MRFFKIKNNKQIEKKNIKLPGTLLTYDESLIDNLKKDHRKLFRMFASCVNAYNKKDMEN